MIILIMINIIISIATMYLFYQHLSEKTQKEIKEKFLGNNNATKILSWQPKNEQRELEEKINKDLGL